MLQAGLKGEARTTVNQNNTAENHASGSLPVFATPMMIALMECAANDAVQPFLPEGQATVGTLINVRHLAATTMGHTVRAECELMEIDRRRLLFKVAAYDDAGLIGEGTHERFIIDSEKFMQKALERQ